MPVPRTEVVDEEAGKMERQVVYHARGRQEELTHRNRVFRKGSPRRQENDFPFPWADTIIGLSKLTPELEAGEECKERPAKVTSRVGGHGRWNAYYVTGLKQ